MRLMDRLGLMEERIRKLETEMERLKDGGAQDAPAAEAAETEAPAKKPRATKKKST